MNITIILLLVLFPFLTLSVQNKDSIAHSINNKINCKFDHSYYPTIDYNLAYELYIIKRNYHRYSDKLKVLADKRIAEITQKADKS